MIHDGRGHPAGQRPGFLFSDANEQAERRVADAYSSMTTPLANVGVRDRGQRSTARTQPEPQTFDSPEAARAAAYAQYNRDIQRAVAQMTDYQNPAAIRAGGPIGEYRRDRANRP